MAFLPMAPAKEALASEPIRQPAKQDRSEHGAGKIELLASPTSALLRAKLGLSLARRLRIPVTARSVTSF